MNIQKTPANEEKIDNNFLRDMLMKHFNHRVCIACYGDPDNPANVSLECEDCNEVVLDTDIYTCIGRTDID